VKCIVNEFKRIIHYTNFLRNGLKLCFLLGYGTIAWILVVRCTRLVRWTGNFRCSWVWSIDITLWIEQ